MQFVAKWDGSSVTLCDQSTGLHPNPVFARGRFIVTQTLESFLFAFPDIGLSPRGYGSAFHNVRFGGKADVANSPRDVRL
jgi:hypothetical protein